VVRALLGWDAHSPRVGVALPPPSMAATLLGPSSAATAAAKQHGGKAALLGSGDSSSQRSDSAAAGSSFAFRTGSSTPRSSSGRSTLLSRLQLFESCFTGGSGGGSMGGSRRLRDTAVHTGSVTSITIQGGRAYSAGGRTKGSTSLLVWDAARGELLRTTSRRSTQWLRSPVSAVTAVVWPRVGRGVVGGLEMHLVTGHANGQVGALGGG